LSIGTVALAWALGLPAAVRRRAVVLVGVELAQGIVGYTQYALHVPAALVGVHMFGACLVWVTALTVALSMRPQQRDEIAAANRSAAPSA